MVSKILTVDTNIYISYGIIMLNPWNTEAKVGGSNLDVPAINMKYVLLTSIFG
jgi:hypothetical protein